jgi:ubiquinone/menaquinone biosynthesis C-methylase UbiE
MEIPPYSPDDLWRGIVVGKKHNYLGNYFPAQFWRDMGEKYRKRFRPLVSKEGKGDPLDENVQVLVPRLGIFQPKTILEIGCGFGRLIPFVLHAISSIERFHGVDFSRTMLDDVPNYIEGLAEPLKKKITLTEADVTEGLPFENHSMDMVYTHVCLTHIPPPYIEGVIREIDRVARSCVIHVERFEFMYEHAFQHRWSHLIPPYYLGLEKGWVLWEYTHAHEEHYTKIIVLARNDEDWQASNRA